MKGKNYLHLNHESMVEAVQYWLSRSNYLPPYTSTTVLSVAEDEEGVFILELTEREAKPE
jgi:hypothetical protein